MPFLLGAIPLAAVVAAFCVNLVARRAGAYLGWLSALVPLSLLAIVGRLSGPVLLGNPATFSLPWFPDLGLRYALRLDGLALLFTVLILVVGLAILVYSVAYMHRGDNLGRFYAQLLLFMGAMLGVVLADDLILLYLFWEVTGLASFFLIGYHDEERAAREGAVQALVVTVAGGVAMLVGLVLLAQAGGSWQISDLVAKAAVIKGDPRYPAILALVLAGAMTKSAQVPFQFWLPSAMVAPTPVSTYLHAATMVWAGVYLLARLLPVLGGTALWVGVVTPVGLATLLTGAGLAIVQPDLKALLAYSTIGALGLAVALIGWGTPAAVAAATAYIVNHAAFKGALFLVAGAVEHETGTRRIDRLGGLGRNMPLLAGTATLAAVSLAGLPPSGGFLSKEAVVDALLRGGAAAETITSGALAAAAVVLSGAFSLAYGARFVGIFFRRRDNGRGAGEGKGVHEPPRLLWGPAAALALPAIVLGLLPHPVERLASLVASEATGIPFKMGMWHGLTATVVAVTGATVALGLLLVWGQPWAIRLGALLSPLSAGRLYEKLYGGTLAGAKALTGVYMTGQLRDYLVYVTLTAVALVSAVLFQARPLALPSLTALEWGPSIAVLVAVAAALAAARVRLLLAAVLALGAAGYSISLVYLLLSAPDIAITQAVIETIALVLFLVAIAALAKTDVGHPHRRPLIHLGVALAAGTISAAMAYAVAGVSHLPRVSAEFFEHAAEAGGMNVVNLVIVDFRGWDTMGEITVLAIAALGIMALAPWRDRQAPGATRAGQVERTGRRPARKTAHIPPMSSPVLCTVAAVASPMIVAYALLLWATGHYGPGGGFVGGLMVSAALLLRSQAFGAELLARRWDFLMAAGLLLAGASEAVPLVAGAPLLQHTLLTAAGLKLPSSLIFDAGVLLLVTGTVMAAARSLVEAA